MYNLTKYKNPNNIFIQMDEKTYAPIQKKYALPGFKNLDKEFEITEIEAKNMLLKHVVKRMGENIEYYVKILDGIMHPETNTASLYECAIFNENEKKQLFALYKKLMYWHRSAVLVDLNYDEKQSAVYIKEFYKEWLGLKEKITLIIEKLKNNWQKEITSKERVEYFG